MYGEELQRLLTNYYYEKTTRTSILNTDFI